MALVTALARSTIGLKALMAITGLVLFGFVIVHMLGNLQVFLGAEVLNAYSAGLHETPALLWGARAVLLASVIAHIVSAVLLAGRNSEARAQRYAVQRYTATTYAARTMYWSGPLLFLFIAYHLLHLTFGYTPGPYAHDPVDVYSNVVRGFQIWYVSGFYIFAQVALGLHLSHGAWSLTRSLGLEHPRWNRGLRNGARILATLITLGNISMPLAVLVGLIK